MICMSQHGVNWTVTSTFESEKHCCLIICYQVEPKSIKSLFLFQVLEISIVYEIYDEADSPAEFEYPPTKPHLGSLSQQSGSVGSYSSATSDGGSPKVRWCFCYIKECHLILFYIFHKKYHA